MDENTTLDSSNDSSNDVNPEEHSPKPRQLPADLPKSLDDRRPASFQPSVEVYDAWQGQSHFISSPLPPTSLNFNLALTDTADELGYIPAKIPSNDTRLEGMKAAQAAHVGDAASTDHEGVATSATLSEDERKDILQKSLHMASSSGDLEKLQTLLSGQAKQYLDVNARDDEGSVPLIYASCFGHDQVVEKLLESGARVDEKDRHGWTSLTWATANGHANIVQSLLRNGASRNTRSSSGRTAAEFAAPDSEISGYFEDNGYKIGSTGVTGDFYDIGLSQDRFEEEMAENEMRHRMMMESARNLEVDLGNLGLDEKPETPAEPDDEHEEFIWDRCLNDQMFVFQEDDLDRLLNIVITQMTPQRSPSQKPVPANVLFLSARYAHYHVNAELLHHLLISAMERINDVVERMQGDMTVLAFWMSNAILLLHYLRKDTHLITATAEIQAQLVDLVNEVFVLIIRDAERRMDKVIDAGMLEHETIAGLDDVQFQNEWNLFKRNKTKAPEDPDKRFRPPSPRRRAKVSPRNITSLLSSTLFVLDLYDIHSVITVQIVAQLLYWLGAELFNRIMSNRKYLSRTKALQVRMNVSILEDWALNNNRLPEHYENGETTVTGISVLEATRYHLAPVKQLLEWLQVSTSVAENLDSLKDTIQQLPRLSPQQILHAVRYYRVEVGEKSLPKAATRLISDMPKDNQRRAKQRHSTASDRSSTPTSAVSEHRLPSPEPPSRTSIAQEDNEPPDQLLLDPALMLPFHLPTSTDMLITYGAGIGGVNRERARKYIPTIPPEIFARLDIGNRQSTGLYSTNRAPWNDD